MNNIENLEIKSDAELEEEIAARERRLTELRDRVEGGTATEEEKREVARAGQLKEQAEIKKSFEN